MKATEKSFARLFNIPGDFCQVNDCSQGRNGVKEHCQDNNKYI